MIDTHTHGTGRLIPLPEVCAALAKAGLPVPRGGFRALQVAAASAKFPAEKRNGRWYTWESDLPEVAAAFQPGPEASR